MRFDEWLQYGYEQGFCSPPVCASHDGVPSSLVEDEEWEEGLDPCQNIVRLYEDVAQRKGIEANSSAVQYRASNLGWKINQPH